MEFTLSNLFRTIENEYGTNKNNAGNTFPSAFSYEARLLTFQELKKVLIPIYQLGKVGN